MEYSYALIYTSLWKADCDACVSILFGEFTIKYFVPKYLQKDQNDSLITMQYWSQPVVELNYWNLIISEDNVQVQELRWT